MKPMILAPAGCRSSFFAALAADADGIYCGLKEFSARIKADNFTVNELIPLTELAHKKEKKVFIAMNSLLKDKESDHAGKLIKMLEKYVKPDALIIQDAGFIRLAREAGFSKELHLSTLASLSFRKALNTAKASGIKTVVLPRELSIDEIKQMAKSAPAGIDFEIFIHGALCYGVSGRCYWSSFFGGKSGLRGMCVQPCRRLYIHKGKKERYFSCKDLCLDFLVKVLLNVENIRAWKIEGRKKGPHYVFHTVKAYKMLRDNGDDPLAKKEAFSLLTRALGRERTHYNFLPQRRFNPTDPDGDTASGMLLGRIKKDGLKHYFITKEHIIKNDLLRIGYEDQSWHKVFKIKRYIPKKGRFYIQTTDKSSNLAGAPVFLIDRMEKSLLDAIADLESLTIEKYTSLPEVYFKSKNPATLYKRKGSVKNLYIYDYMPDKIIRNTAADLTYRNLSDLSGKNASSIYWNLPPIIWPDNENEIKKNLEYAIRKGSANFIINSLWQISLFHNTENLNIIGGPFCNIANIQALIYARDLGIKSVILSPELGKDDYLDLPRSSPIPLGIIITGHFPLSISRITPNPIEENTSFISPKGEVSFIKKNGYDYRVYPNWQIDLNPKKAELEKAGYAFFVHMKTDIPKTIDIKQRAGLWNWDIGLK